MGLRVFRASACGVSPIYASVRPDSRAEGVSGHPTSLTAGLCRLAILLRFCLRGDYDRDVDSIT